MVIDVLVYFVQKCASIINIVISLSVINLAIQISGNNEYIQLDKAADIFRHASSIIMRGDKKLDKCLEARCRR